MKKMILTLLAAVGIPGILAYARVFGPAKEHAGTPTATPLPLARATATPDPAPSGTPASAASPTPSPASAGQYKDGQYDGSAVDIGYGTVQIEATVSGGRLSAVTFLQAPNEGHSGQLAAYAEPILRQEALQAQSASVDGASGATATSEGFAQSLQDALAQAR